ncbi:hypothetical protein KEM54_006826 [Ascosphaera aggregata]|nr:hypothetical protein KEM54_006826 [Ascosphaera aggregata]
MSDNIHQDTRSNHLKSSSSSSSSPASSPPPPPPPAPPPRPPPPPPRRTSTSAQAQSAAATAPASTPAAAAAAQGSSPSSAHVRYQHNHNHNHQNHHHHHHHHQQQQQQQNPHSHPHPHPNQSQAKDGRHSYTPAHNPTAATTTTTTHPDIYNTSGSSSTSQSRPGNMIQQHHNHNSHNQHHRSNIDPSQPNSQSVADYCRARRIPSSSSTARPPTTMMSGNPNALHTASAPAPAPATSTATTTTSDPTNAPPIGGGSTKHPESPVLAPAYPSMASLADAAADLTSPSRIKVRNLSHIHSFASEEMLGAAATASYANIADATTTMGARGRSVSAAAAVSGGAGAGGVGGTFQRQRAGSGLFGVEFQRSGVGSLPSSLGGRQYEISSMPVTDVIEMVAGILTKITTTNDAQHEPLHKYLTPQDSNKDHSPTPHTFVASPPNAAAESSTPPRQSPTPPLDPQSSSVLAFHGRNIPSISILSYLTRIHRYCPTTYEVFLSLLVYFDRMSAKVNGPLMQRILMKERAQERAKRNLERQSSKSKKAKDSCKTHHAAAAGTQGHQVKKGHRHAQRSHGSAISDPTHPPLRSSRYLSNQGLQPGPVHNPTFAFAGGTAGGDASFQGPDTDQVYESSFNRGNQEPSQSSTEEDLDFAFPPAFSSASDSVTESDFDSSASSDDDDDSYGDDVDDYDDEKSGFDNPDYTETVFDGLDEDLALSRTFVIDSYNVHRLVIAGVTCASKFFSDVFYTNSRYAKVGGLPLTELNHLELQFLFLNDFRLSVTVEELEAYGTMLVEFYASEVLAQQREREQKQRESLMRAQAQFSRPPNDRTNEQGTADDVQSTPMYRSCQQSASSRHPEHGMPAPTEEVRRASAGSTSSGSDVCMRSATSDRERDRGNATAVAAAAALRRQQTEK